MKMNKIKKNKSLNYKILMINKIIISISFICFSIFDLAAATGGTDNDSVNKEINKLLLQIAPETKTFTWSCTTVSEFPLNHIASGAFHVIDECIVNTDSKKEFKMTCEYSILHGINGAIKCSLGW